MQVVVLVVDHVRRCGLPSTVGIVLNDNRASGVAYAGVEWKNSCVKVLRRVDVFRCRSHEAPLCGSRAEQSREKREGHTGTFDVHSTAHRDAEKRASS